ncbi:hypothetical protein [Domibacillus iocasae]|uniref:Uncharacterized protein n=1 Tax=Domibacillus iocasae TaxID=1714016 RepID=A0A1E7DSW6_9BACI|nr:hypothetical protein [Domibacillus iocasae]OES46160.1 hypothetical protein BA724_16440 [Domibacillus iocasae]
MGKKDKKKKKQKPMTLEERFASGERAASAGNFNRDFKARAIYTSNNMNDAINKLSKARGQGFKTMFVKHAFEKVLREEYGWDPDKDQDDWPSA